MVWLGARARIAGEGEVDFEKSAVGLLVEDRPPWLVAVRNLFLRPLH
jgi:hypothetical protein